MFLPDSILKDRYVNLVYSSDYTSGGHFAAFEHPTIMASDIYKAISIMES